MLPKSGHDELEGEEDDHVRWECSKENRMCRPKPCRERRASPNKGWPKAGKERPHATLSMGCANHLQDTRPSIAACSAERDRVLNSRLDDI